MIYPRKATRWWPLRKSRLTDRDGLRISTECFINAIDQGTGQFAERLGVSDAGVLHAVTMQGAAAFPKPDAHSQNTVLENERHAIARIRRQNVAIAVRQAERFDSVRR